MGLYEFKEDDAYRFANHVHIQCFERGEELWFRTCPFCHGKGKSNEKTFSINLRTGQFCCFRESCKRQGNMVDLAREFDFSLGNNVDEYYNPKKQFKKLPTPKEPVIPKDPAVAYLASRGISKAIAEKYQITCQTEHPNVLCMPFIDENGVWQFVKYRKTDFDKSRDSNKEWCEKDCKPILYGMYQCNLDNKTLIITEGQLDSLSVSECNIENAVSVPTGANGFTWIPHCWNWVNKFEKIIVFGDHEKGHITLLDDIKKRFKAEIWHVREEDYKDCKDANDILRKYGKSQIRACIDNAVRVSLEYANDIADTKDINIYDIEKLKTGVHDLDYILHGGLPFGGFTIVTGKRSEGKSTFASQILSFALNQGYKCLSYSGEMPDWQFKAWLVKQIAGANHTFMYQNKDGGSGYEVSKSNKALINEWLRGKMYILDNVKLTDEHIDLLDAVENVIQQYGVRVILLDNLMTAIAAMIHNKSEKYEVQSQFTVRVADMAKKYNVLIILVAHKRKDSYGADEMDDILGSSDIANLAHVILSYGRDREINEDQRILRLLKNRMFGKVYFKGWVMDFDERSNRIYGVNDNSEKEFEWTKLIPKQEEFKGADMEEIPFD